MLPEFTAIESYLFDLSVAKYVPLLVCFCTVKVTKTPRRCNELGKMCAQYIKNKSA